MIYTFGYAKQKLAKFVDSGSCPTNPNVGERINEAIENILLIEDWHLTLQKMRFFVKNDSFPLPHFVERIVTCRFDIGVPGRVNSKFFEFMEGGPLNDKWDQSGMKALLDLGDNHATMFEVPRDKTLHLIALTDSIADANLALSIRMKTTKDHDAAETLPVSPWKGLVEGTILWDTLAFSSLPVTAIDSLVKPMTTGYITLLAVDKTTKETWMLAKYHPHETNPGFRRYGLMNAAPDADGTQVEINAIVKMRYVPAINDNDPLLVQNMPALKAMIQALRENDSGKFETGMAFKKECIWLLKQQLAKAEPNGNEFTIESDHGFGGIGSV